MARNMKKKKEEPKKKEKTVLNPCSENAYIVNKNKVRKDTGLTENAKILMENCQ
jgi:hypothetical protein